MRSVSVRRYSGLAVAILGVLPCATPRDAYAQTPQFRAFWADVFHEGCKSTAEIDAMVARAVAGNYNAIVVEVMAYHDNNGNSHGAYWNSNIIPKSPGIIGDIDPLAYLIQQAHASGIEVHPWLVAYRIGASWPPGGNTFLEAHPECLTVPQESMGTRATVGGYYVLDPGSPDVQEYLVSIVRELVTNYEIDGIHWDYIRYTTTNAGYPSDASYANSSLARYRRITGSCGTPPYAGDAAWNDFRRRGINELVRRLRAEIPAITTNPRQPLRHAASLIPWSDAPADFTDSSAYKSCFQDWRLWMEQGWLDAGCPMLYDREYDSSQYQYYRNWVNAALGWRYNRHMYLGQANYMNTMADSITQLQYAYAAGADGSVNYSYVSTTDSNKDGAEENDWTWYPYVRDNLFTAPAPLPTMPWRNPATATEGTLYGRITDAATGQPIDDATVQVGALPAVQTDGNGYYVVTMIPAAAAGTSYDVTASKARHTSAAHTAVQVVAGDIRRDDLSLSMQGLPPPTITQQPQPQNVPKGGTAAFTVAATGEGTLTYQWMKDCVNVSDGGHVSGATTPTLTVATIDASDAASYCCAVTGDGGTTISNEAMLTLLVPAPFEFVVESRSGGKNYTNYSEIGTWSSSTAKSSAPGTTGGIGSRWAYQDPTTYGVNKAVYSFTPTQSGIYEACVTWPSSANASPYVEHIVTHAEGANSVLLYQYGSSYANKWNSLGQYRLDAGATYTVTQTNEYWYYTSYIIRADAVKWKWVGNGGIRAYDFPMDADPGWSAEGQWAFGTPIGGGAEYGFPDPTSGFSGANVYGYNLEGNYGLNLPATHLTSTSINCTGLKGVNLRFRRWLVVYDPYYDHAYVQVSKDGTRWTTIWQNSLMVLDQSWAYQVFDISAVADNQPTVYLRWTMGPTGNAIQLAGWNIDDVEVWGTMGDFDNDGDVDLTDFARFQNCFNGPNRAVAQTDCGEADADHDSDVDLMDFSVFQSCFNGPNRPPACN